MSGEAFSGDAPRGDAPMGGDTRSATQTDPIARSVARIRATGRAPRIAVLLGSGWQPFAACVRDAVTLPYSELPAFPLLGVEGHAGALVLGRTGAHEVAVLSGRKHTYETGDASVMAGAIATLAACGVGALVQTNAAGSLDAAMRPGALMLIADHLNIAQIDEALDAGFAD